LQSILVSCSRNAKKWLLLSINQSINGFAASGVVLRCVALRCIALCVRRQGEGESKGKETVFRESSTIQSNSIQSNPIQFNRARRAKTAVRVGFLSNARSGLNSFRCSFSARFGLNQTENERNEQDLPDLALSIESRFGS